MRFNNRDTRIFSVIIATRLWWDYEFPVNKVCGNLDPKDLRSLLRKAVKSESFNKKNC
jgi:hypothetical protein